MKLWEMNKKYRFLAPDNGAGDVGVQGQEPTQTEPQESNQKLPDFDGFLADPKNQAEFDRRVAKALETAKGNWEKDAQKRATEAEKLAKLSAEQRAQVEQERREKAIAEREAAITRRELLAAAKEQLVNDKLPPELAECIDYTDAETSTARLEAIKKAFMAAVSKSVDDRLRKPPPKTGDPNTVSIDVALRKAAGLKIK